MGEGGERRTERENSLFLFSFLFYSFFPPSFVSVRFLESLPVVIWYFGPRSKMSATAHRARGRRWSRKMEGRGGEGGKGGPRGGLKGSMGRRWGEKVGKARRIKGEGSGRGMGAEDGDGIELEEGEWG